jgi:cell division GTPase FtsZ
MEKILKLCSESFIGVDQVIVAAGIGGGTGTGTIQVVCEVLVENGYNVIPLITLPRDQDSFEEKKNAIDFMGAFQEMINSGMVASPIIVDNNLLYNHYLKHATWNTEWKMDSNQQIVNAINEMNAASGIASPTTLDGAELLKLQRSGGCSSIGKFIIRVSDTNQENLEEIVELLHAELIDSLHNGLLCDYANLSEARAAGVQVLLPETMPFGISMEQSIDMALKETMPTLVSKFVGYVPVEGLNDIVVYSLVSGLGFPERVDELMKSATKDAEHLAQNEAKRSIFQSSELTIRNPYAGTRKTKKPIVNPFAKIEG